MCPAHATAKGLCSRAWRSVSTVLLLPGRVREVPGVRECPAAPPRAGKFPRGLRRRPGPFGCDALSRSAFPSFSCEPRSLICCRWDVGAGVTRRGPGWRSCPGSASPAGSGAETPALPHRRSIPARVSPFPRDAPVPLPRSPPSCGGDARRPPSLLRGSV